MNVLIMGGSKFMGLDLIENLLLFDNVNLFIVNRGKSHWNDKFYEIFKNKENIYHLIVDRNEEELLFKKLQDEMTFNNLEYFDYVIDFCCYEPIHFIILMNALQNKLNKYILISTDSVYNVSEIALERDLDFFNNNKQNEIKKVDENDAILPKDEKLLEKMKKKDEYGYNKFITEQVSICDIGNKELFQ